MRRSLAPSQLTNKRASFHSPVATETKRRRTGTKNNTSECRKILEDISFNQQDTRLTHEEIIKKLSQPYKCPLPNYVCSNSNRTLGMRRNHIRRPLYDPNTANALVLYAPPEVTEHEKLQDNSNILVAVVVDPVLSNILRPHQREGVKFMYDCVTGKQIDGSFGCIMADEMGLGKTLQCITLLWTLLRQGPECRPTIQKAIIVCPSSLVKNWSNEINKWLSSRLIHLVIDGGPDLKKKLTQFMQAQGRAAIPLLIISYETFRMQATILHSSEIGLVMCDEGHRLKNCENQTYK